jgi:DNA sulfur modification protein DndD
VKISRVEFRNFRQHRNVEIDLSGSGGEFAIIQGRNGAGKTNLLKGISWVINGKLALDEQKFNVDTLLSHGAILSSQPGQETTVYGAIELDLGDSGLARVEREAKFVGTNNGMRYDGSEVAVNTMRNASLGWSRESDADLWLESYLPRRFSHYFLFDGEHLNRFFRETEAAFVEQAVLEIASIDQLSRMVDHLETVAKDLVKAAGRGQGAEADQNVVNFERYSERLVEVRGKIQVLKNEAAEYRDLISEATEKLGDVRAIEADMKRRSDAERQAQAASLRRIEGQNELESWVTKFGPSLWLTDSIQGLAQAIRQAHDDKVLPPPFKADTLRELLASHVCVCGRELEPAGQACLHIEKVIEEFNSLSEVGEILSELQVHLYAVTSGARQSSGQLSAVIERIRAATKEEEDANSQFELLKRKLAANDDEAIALLSRNLDKYQTDLGNTEREIGRLEVQEKQFLEDIDDARRKIESRAQADERAQKALRKAQFAEEALSAARELYETLSDQVREEVARNLDEEFQAMIWKKGFFQPVEVDPKYKVMVRNMQGFEIRESLSAGETACLAFAFSLTLSKVAGFYYPMVVDSPFGRLDSEVKEFVSQVLSRVLRANAERSGNQLIMLMTDGEYTETVSEVMAASNPRLFELDFDQSTGETTILRVSS